MLVTSIAGVVFAAPDIDKTIGDIDGAKAGDTTKVTNIGGKIINIIQVVGIVVAIAVVLIIGIKYMTGSVEQKQNTKSNDTIYHWCSAISSWYINSKSYI